MNDKAKQVDQLIKQNPSLIGKFIGFKYSRGGMGVSRIDNDWYECDEYYISADDLAEFLKEQENDE